MNTIRMKTPTGLIDIGLNESEKKRLLSKALRSLVQSCLNQLNSLERTILQMRFGLGQEEPKDYEAIAQAVHIGPAAVKIIEAIALQKLRCLEVKAPKRRKGGWEETADAFEA